MCTPAKFLRGFIQTLSKAFPLYAAPGRRSLGRRERSHRRSGSQRFFFKSSISRRNGSRPSPPLREIPPPRPTFFPLTSPANSLTSPPAITMLQSRFVARSSSPPFLCPQVLLFLTGPSLNSYRLEDDSRECLSIFFLEALGVVPLLPPPRRKSFPCKEPTDSSDRRPTPFPYLPILPLISGVPPELRFPLLPSKLGKDRRARFEPHSGVAEENLQVTLR